MDRRNSIRLIIASAIAPAFVAEGLMKIKPIIVPDPIYGPALPMDHHLDTYRYAMLYQDEYNRILNLAIKTICEQQGFFNPRVFMSI